MPDMTDLIAVVDGLKTKVQEYIENAGDVLPTEEIEQVVGGLNKIVGVYNAIQAVRMKFFLEGFCKGEITSEKLEKLLQYVNSPRKAEYISDLFGKILMSKSRYATGCMGILVADMINENREVTHEDLMFVNALAQFTDFDLRNFYELFHREQDGEVLRNSFSEENGEATSFDITVAICEQYYIIKRKEAEGYWVDQLDGSEPPVQCDHFLITDIGRRLYEKIKEVENYL